MMKQIRKSSKFKKDLKRYKNDKVKLSKLSSILHILANGEDIPQHYKPHYLKGKYKGCLECHIENDFLLIWIDPNDNTIILERLGSHSDLFK